MPAETAAFETGEIFVRNVFQCGLCWLLIAAPLLASASDVAETCTEKLAQIRLPAADLPSDKDRARLHNCSPVDLYYGLGDNELNVRDARLCAYIEELDQTGGYQMPTETAGVLMVIYANGSGVPRNAQLAKHFACEIEWETADRERLLDNIESHMKSGTPAGVCDVAPYWPINDICAGYTEAIESKRIERERKALVAHWPTPRQKAFAPLEQAEKVYETKREQGEILELDRPERQDWIRNKFRTEFLDALKSLDASSDASAKDPAALDRELNENYRKTLKALELANPDQPEVAASRTANLRNGERAWLRYVDAWETFRSAAYPDIPAARLRALLTQQRVAALQALKEEFRLDDYWPEDPPR